MLIGVGILKFVGLLVFGMIGVVSGGVLGIVLNSFEVMICGVGMLVFRLRLLVIV